LRCRGARRTRPLRAVQAGFVKGGELDRYRGMLVGPIAAVSGPRFGPAHCPGEGRMTVTRGDTRASAHLCHPAIRAKRLLPDERYMPGGSCR